MIGQSPTCFDSDQCGSGINVWRRRRHHKGGTVLRLATVFDTTSDELISHNAPGVSCLRIRYRQAPTAPAPICYQFLRQIRAPSGDGQRPWLIDGREAFEERPSSTVVQRPGARGSGVRAEKRRTVRYRAGPVVSRYTMLHQRLVEERWRGLFGGERVGSAVPRR